MNSQQIEQWLKNQERIAIATEKIASILEQSLHERIRVQARSALRRSRVPAPNYKAILEQFANYDWSAISRRLALRDRCRNRTNR